LDQVVKKYERFYFKYFPIHILIFEKTWAQNVICSSLGLDDLTEFNIWWTHLLKSSIIK
jgi:hypothetical protein